MITIINNRIPTIGGRLISKVRSTDVVLTFDVIGTFWPARPESLSGSEFYLVNTFSVPNTVYIDFGDGTGEHTYPFLASGNSRRAQWSTNNFVTDPATLSVTGPFQYPAYFYQDLPEGVINTVNDSYNHMRTVRLRFANPQALSEININRMRLYNQLPADFAKLQSLKTLTIRSSLFITSFPQYFLNTQIENLTLSSVGDVMNNGFPDWVLNSPIINLNLTDSINLSGSAETKKFDKINKLKNTLGTLLLNGANIDYTIPLEFSQLYKLQSVNFDNNMSTGLRFPVSLTGLDALSSIIVTRTRMPMIEYERIIQGIPALRTFEMKNLNQIVDFDFAATNNYLETIRIGGSTWNGGAVPSFINKLLALKVLDLTQLSGNLSTFFSGWGNFANCVNLDTINISRITTIPTTIPSWFSGLTKLKTITAPATYNSLARVNAFVDNLYTFVTSNAPISGTSANAFRNMSINIYGVSTIDTTNSVRPSGTYQMPTGYVAGNNNGTPASQMEKIWVLANQYAHTWVVKPA